MARFILKKSKNGKYFFNLLAGNNQVILTSELYEERRSAEGGIASVQKNGGIAARFEEKMATSGKAYFVLKATNGEIIGRSETYSSSSSMKKGMASVMKNAASTMRSGYVQNDTRAICLM